MYPTIAVDAHVFKMALDQAAKGHSELAHDLMLTAARAALVVGPGEYQPVTNPFRLIDDTEKTQILDLLP